MRGKNVKLMHDITWKRNSLEWDFEMEKVFEQVCEVGARVLAGLGVELKIGGRDVRKQVVA